MSEHPPERPGSGGPPHWSEVPERLHPSPGIAPRWPDRGASPAVSPPPAEQPSPPPVPPVSPPPVAPPAQTPPAQTSPLPPVAAPSRGVGAPVQRGPRRAHLAIRRVDPWSVLKMTFVFSLGLLVVGLVAVVVLYGILDGMGVFTSITRFLHDISSGLGSAQSYASLPRVFGYTLLVGIVNVVLLTALATLGAFVYNLCVDLVGGVEVTLTERD